jgi:hypothetical protein
MKFFNRKAVEVKERKLDLIQIQLLVPKDKKLGEDLFKKISTIFETPMMKRLGYKVVEITNLGEYVEDKPKLLK